MAATTVNTIFFDLGDTLVTTSRQWLPGAKAVLETLHARGLRLGVLSNTAALTRPQVLALLPDDFAVALFQPELLILSSEVLLEKPAIAFFQLAVQRAMRPAAQCLFCTESLVDTLAAQRVGMRVARLQPPPHSDLTSLIDALQRVHLL